MEGIHILRSRPEIAVPDQTYRHGWIEWAVFRPTPQSCYW